MSSTRCFFRCTVFSVYNLARAIRRNGDLGSDFSRVPGILIPTFKVGDEVLALIPHPNPLFPTPPYIIQRQTATLTVEGAVAIFALG